MLWLVQAGYHFPGTAWEIAARWSALRRARSRRPVATSTPTTQRARRGDQLLPERPRQQAAVRRHFSARLERRSGRLHDAYSGVPRLAAWRRHVRPPAVAARCRLHDPNCRHRAICPPSEWPQPLARDRTGPTRTVPADPEPRVGRAPRGCPPHERPRRVAAPGPSSCLGARAGRPPSPASARSMRGHGRPRRHPHPRGPPAQPEGRRRRHPPRRAHGDHGRVGLREVLPRPRHALRRGAAAVRRDLLRLRAAVPRPHGPAGRRRRSRASRRPSPSSARVPCAAAAPPSGRCRSCSTT